MKMGAGTGADGGLGLASEEPNEGWESTGPWLKGPSRDRGYPQGLVPQNSEQDQGHSFRNWIHPRAGN